VGLPVGTLAQAHGFEGIERHAPRNRQLAAIREDPSHE
jgi:hypothetical protein